MILIYVTHPTEEHAVSILKTLVDEKLVACGNIYPIRSIYPWEGEIVNENEYVSILKSIPKLKDSIIKRITELHEYKIPCIITFNIEANPVYKNWILDCLKIDP